MDFYEWLVDPKILIIGFPSLLHSIPAASDIWLIFMGLFSPEAINIALRATARRLRE